MYMYGKHKTHCSGSPFQTPSSYSYEAFWQLAILQSCSHLTISDYIKLKPQIINPSLREHLDLIARVGLCFSISTIERFWLWITERDRAGDPDTWRSFSFPYG